MKTNWIKKVLSVVLAGAMVVCLAAAVFFYYLFPATDCNSLFTQYIYKCKNKKY